MRKAVVFSAMATLTFAVASAAANAANVIPTGTASAPAGDGILRDGSGWDYNYTPSNIGAITSPTLQPDGRQWNNGSFWWDSSQTPSPYYITVTLPQSYTFDHLVLQADNNDSYLVEYWNGTAWQSAFTAGDVNGWGLTTRDSGTLASFTTDQFRLSAVSGDQYYAISGFQAFTTGVPEPATWALMILGFGAVGGMMRRRGKATVRFA
ncbi:PEP-CTERM sorting domain-containing protein [Sphingomonas sp. CL5.1]|uniref:PEPxxWA-CTERM sorting domain-containing protein n=1 Tax=Sphingomonas sp. CL5.1 TaxID=2653203 RepID=UPI001581808F|nr:PEPxxWA-CTERM sorting domain-containing protein [Sphingomonas sp. CL5.1]QKR98547.1 PEP-CTERM sorting domain-containing protein [Sphingomonas sp. CL5.1]